jgi:hypothetical protein
VLQDLRLVQATGIGTIRLFSSRAFARTVLEVIRDNNLDLKVQLGAYPNPVPAPRPRPTTSPSSTPASRWPTSSPTSCWR